MSPMSRTSGYTLSQERALAICPKISASLSIPCSMLIVYEVVRQHRKSKNTTAVQRALLAMSCVDILASSAWFLSTWAVPRESGFAYAAGNRATCTFQGFLLQLAIGAPLYNSSLALFYLLMIKLRWRDDQLVVVERWVHGVILTFSIGTSFLLLPLDQYNHIGAVCWVIGDPPGCDHSSYQPNEDVPCERGDDAWAWGLALFYIPLWISVIACSVSMAILYLEVRKVHRKSLRHSVRIPGAQHSLHRSGGDTVKVATQAILYSSSFFITWTPSTLWSIAHWFNWSHYGLDLAAACMEPLQGFWNFLIFIRSRPQVARHLQSLVASVVPFVSHPSSINSHSNSHHQDGLGNSRLSRQSDNVGTPNTNGIVSHLSAHLLGRNITPSTETSQQDVAINSQGHDWLHAVQEVSDNPGVAVDIIEENFEHEARGESDDESDNPSVVVDIIEENIEHEARGESDYNHEEKTYGEASEGTTSKSSDNCTLLKRDDYVEEVHATRRRQAIYSECTRPPPSEPEMEPIQIEPTNNAHLEAEALSEGEVGTSQGESTRESTGCVNVGTEDEGTQE